MTNEIKDQSITIGRAASGDYYFSLVPDSPVVRMKDGTGFTDVPVPCVRPTEEHTISLNRTFGAISGINSKYVVNGDCVRSTPETVIIAGVQFDNKSGIIGKIVDATIAERARPVLEEASEYASKILGKPVSFAPKRAQAITKVGFGAYTAELKPLATLAN